MAYKDPQDKINYTYYNRLAKRIYDPVGERAKANAQVGAWRKNNPKQFHETSGLYYKNHKDYLLTQHYAWRKTPTGMISVSRDSKKQWSNKYMRNGKLYRLPPADPQLAEEMEIIENSILVGANGRRYTVL